MVTREAGRSRGGRPLHLHSSISVLSTLFICFSVFARVQRCCPQWQLKTITVMTQEASQWPWNDLTVIWLGHNSGICEENIHSIIQIRAASHLHKHQNNIFNYRVSPFILKQLYTFTPWHLNQCVVLTLESHFQCTKPIPPSPQRSYHLSASCQNMHPSKKT